MARTYKTSELLQMADEGKTCKVKGPDGETYKLGKNYNGKGAIFSAGGVAKGYLKNDEWELVQEPVEFATAAKAFLDGKNVRCEYPGLVDGSNYTDIFKQGSEKGLTPIEPKLTFYTILNGKWFIEEAE